MKSLKIKTRHPHVEVFFPAYAHTTKPAKRIEAKCRLDVSELFHARLSAEESEAKETAIDLEALKCVK
jgi:hypothetical protein